MAAPKISDLKTFVPANDYAVSKKFYVGLGGTVNWENDEATLCEIELGPSRFFLQDYYVKDWADNSMLMLTVDDARAWYDHAATLIKSGGLGAARLLEPKQEHHGLVTYVWDPCGVLLHFTQFNDSTE